MLEEIGASKHSSKNAYEAISKSIPIKTNLPSTIGSKTAAPDLLIPTTKWKKSRTLSLTLANRPH